LAVVSGILLVCFVDGANSSLGLWHYRIGIFVSVLGVLHILKRKRGLYKGGEEACAREKGRGEMSFYPSNAFSILVSVSNERFSLPFSILEMYC